MDKKKGILEKFYQTLLRFAFECGLSPTEVIADIVRRSRPSDRDITAWLETIGDKINKMEISDE